MMIMRGNLTRVLFMICGILEVSAQTEIGRISAINGQVQVDAFGDGSFLDAVENEVVYRQTVIRTGREGSALLHVAGSDVVLAPGSRIVVAEN